MDVSMVQHIDLIPVNPDVASGPDNTGVDASPPPRSRSHSDGESSAASSSVPGRFRVRRVRRRVGTADEPGVSQAGVSAVSRPAVVVGSPDMVGGTAVPEDVGVTTPGGADTTGRMSAPADSTVGGSADGGSAAGVDDVALVQRLQAAEAQELARLGLRRECISAIGLFLGELASIVDRDREGSDLSAEDVQWCLHVLDAAIQNVMEVQDYVCTILGRRLRGRECVLPDGAARGAACQASHAVVVGLARAVLDGLHERVANAWLDPETLPAELRRDPALFVDAYGELGGYGDVVVAPVPAEETGEAPDVVDGEPSGALSSSDVPTTLQSSGVQRRRTLFSVDGGRTLDAAGRGVSLPSAVLPAHAESVAGDPVPVPGEDDAAGGLASELPGGTTMLAEGTATTVTARERSRSPRVGVHGDGEDVSLMQRLDQDEAGLLHEAGMSKTWTAPDAGLSGAVQC